MFLVAFAYGVATGFWIGFLWQPYLRRPRERKILIPRNGASEKLDALDSYVAGY